MIEHKDKLDKLYADRLEIATVCLPDSDEGKCAFKDAAALTDRQIELMKLEIEERKVENEERKLALEEKKQKFEPIKVIAVPVGLFVLETAATAAFMVAINNFEKTETYTTTPGRALGDWFRRRFSK